MPLMCLWRRDSSRQNSLSRNGCRCSRPPSRHRWRQHLPLLPNRPVPLRMKTKRMTYDSRIPFSLSESLPGTVLAGKPPSAVVDRDLRCVWPLVHISDTRKMHIWYRQWRWSWRGMSTWWYQNLKFVWFEKLLIKFGLSPRPPFLSYFRLIMSWCYVVSNL